MKVILALLSSFITANAFASVAYVSTTPIPWGFAATPITSASFTPASGNTILVLGEDYWNSGQTLTLTGTGAFTPGTANNNATNSTTQRPFYNSSATASSQTMTLTSGGSGDNLFAWAIQYSGVSTISGSLAESNAPGTATGAILGNSVSVPTGSILVAICIQEGNFAGETITSPGGTSRGGGYVTGTVGSYRVTEYAGAGSAIQPSFTASVGTHYYLVAQWILSPVSGARAGQFFLSKNTKKRKSEEIRVMPVGSVCGPRRIDTRSEAMILETPQGPTQQTSGAASAGN